MDFGALADVLANVIAHERNFDPVAAKCKREQRREADANVNRIESCPFSAPVPRPHAPTSIPTAQSKSGQCYAIRCEDGAEALRFRPVSANRTDTLRPVRQSHVSDF